MIPAVAPDESLVIGHGVIETFLAVEQTAFAPMVGRVHQEGKRHFENIGDLVRIGMKIERGLDHRQNGRDRKAAARQVARQIADDLGAVGGKPDFLIRFAQRRPFRRSVLGVYGPARKGDLAECLRNVSVRVVRSSVASRPRSTTGTSTAASRIFVVTMNCVKLGLRE